MPTSDSVAELLERAYKTRFSTPADARRDLVQAVAICRGRGPRRDLIRALKALGQIERDQGKGAAAEGLYAEAVSLCRAEGDRLLLAHTVRHLGDVHREAGQRNVAQLCYDEALALYRGHENTQPLDLANAIRSFALLKEQIGATGEAKRLWQEAHDLYVNAGVAQGVAGSAAALALLAWREGDRAGSRGWLAKAAAAAESSGDADSQQFVRSVKQQIER